MNKDKYLQIFNYLLEFSKFRSKPVRDIESSDTQYLVCSVTKKEWGSPAFVVLTISLFTTS